MKNKKQPIPESLRKQLSEAGKKSWEAKLKKAAQKKTGTSNKQSEK